MKITSPKLAARRRQLSEERRIVGLLDRLVEVVPAELTKDGFAPNCCVLATRIACEALPFFEVRAEPEVVQCLATSGNYGPESGKAIMLGDGEATGPTCYVGHLVAIVADRWLLDLTLGQASRPGEGLVLPAALHLPLDQHLGGGPEWAGYLTAATREDGARIEYRRHPAPPPFLDAPDWAGDDVHRADRGALVLRVIRRLQGSLAAY